MGFREWLKQVESTPSTRNALGIYPPQADTIFVRPSYSQANFCRKIKMPGVKLDNMNTASLCGKKKKS